MIRVVLPAHLRELARVSGEVALDIAEPVTQRALIDALEARFPALLGTTRDPATQRRRAKVRFFACQRDLSHEEPGMLLPQPVRDGVEPFLIVAAISGG